MNHTATPTVAPSNGFIRLEKVNKTFGDNHVLRDVSTHFEVGQVTAILGASGSGKSTLLRLLNRLEFHDSGSIVVNGIEVNDANKNLEVLRRDLGMVFQQFNLFPHLSALGNITLAMRRVRKLSAAEADAQAMVLLERVGMQAHAQKHPYALSGGQQQRIAIARALAMEPKAILFDEPTSALDPEMVKEVLDVMKQLAQSGMTMIIVTHEMGFAKEVADRIVFLDKGRIAVDTNPAAFFDSQNNERVRTFLGQVSH
jgi:polar amino acid transport system ATP-binding protein